MAVVVFINCCKQVLEILPCKTSAQEYLEEGLGGSGDRFELRDIADFTFSKYRTVNVEKGKFRACKFLAFSS